MPFMHMHCHICGEVGIAYGIQDALTQTKQSSYTALYYAVCDAVSYAVARVEET